MTEDEVKKIRHSFSNPNEQARFAVNRFGHTVLVEDEAQESPLSEQNVLEHEEMTIQVNGAGDIEATGKSDLWSHPALLQYAERQGFDSSALRAAPQETPVAQEAPEPEPDSPAPSFDLFDQLSASLDDLDADVASLLHVQSHTLPVTQNKAKFEKAELLRPESIEAPQKPLISGSACSDAACGAMLPSGARFCPQCGKAQLVNFCGSCGYPYQGAERFCPTCGSKR